MHWRDYQFRQRLFELPDDQAPLRRFLSYLDEGEGAPLVLLHGTPTWGYLWQGFLPSLTARHRVLVPDLLGHGYSDRRDGFDRSIAAQADALLAWLDALGIDEATVVGHGTGGGVAMRLAALHPRRVSRLCLMGSVGYDAWPSLDLFLLGRMGQRMPLASFLPLVRHLIRRGCVEAPPVALLDGLVAPWATEVGRVSLLRDCAALDCNHTMELLPLLPRYAAPALLLWGEQDPTLSVGERLAFELPDAELVRLPRAGHYALLDQPDLVAERLERFLAAPAPRRLGVEPHPTLH